MSPNELLMTIVRETNLAATLVNQLARHAGQYEVVLVADRDVREAVNQLERHLGAASAAALALRSIAAGNLQPREG